MGWKTDDLEPEQSGFDAGTFHVEEAEAAYSDFDADKDDDDRRAQLVLRGTFVLQDGEEFPDHTKRYSAGTKFNVTDGGRAFIHRDGEEKNFNEQSAIWDLISTTLDVYPGLQERGDSPRDVSVWEGLSFEGRTVDRGSFERDDGTTQAIRRFLPTKVWAREDSESGGSPKANGDDEDVEKKLAAIKAAVTKEDGDYSDFLVKATDELNLEVDDERLEKVWG